ncbi:hypothetical protein V502_03446 [Pseudogymnoascus sp. VKM F-4520 (FW-2644)]|nr:hypothetical protein V502_03446 [Pseudogymnoascus sp. VKM F-4520 (FW-2644)]
MHKFTRHSSHKANDDLWHSSEALKLRCDLFIKTLRKPGVRENSQNGKWQNETSVRHVQEPSVNFGGSGSQTTPPQQPWQGDDFEHPSPYSQRDGSGSGYPSREKLPFVQRDGNGTPDSHKEGSSSGGGNRGWRHSAWGSRNQQQQNGSLGVTGTT